MFFAVALIGVAASPAKAEWQFTKWGMSVDHVREKCPLKCIVVPHDQKQESSIHLEMPGYIIGDMDFTVRFFFHNKSGTLIRVQLYAERPNYLAFPGLWLQVVEGLASKYGAPTLHDIETMDWGGSTERYLWIMGEEIADLRWSKNGLKAKSLLTVDYRLVDASVRVKL